MDEDQASAGAQFGPTALLHPWKTAVTLPLSRSMTYDSRAASAATVQAVITLNGFGRRIVDCSERAESVDKQSWLTAS